MDELILAVYLYEFYSSLGAFIFVGCFASIAGFFYHAITLRYDVTHEIYGIKRLFTDEEVKVKKYLRAFCLVSFFTLLLGWTVFPSQHNLSLYVLYQIENNQNDLKEPVKNYLNKWKEKRYAN